MKKYLILLLVFFFCQAAQSEPVPISSLDLNQFKKIIVLQEGRLKPLDTYASDLLLRFSGKKNYQKKSAINWLASVLFYPEESYEQKIFLINNPELLEAIGVEPDKHRRYSFNQLKTGGDKLHEFAGKAFDIEEKKRSNLDKEFLRVFSNFHQFIQLVNSMQFNHKQKNFLVESEETRKYLYLKNKENSLLDIIEKSGRLERVLEKFQKLEIKKLKALERDVLRLSMNLFQFVEQIKQYNALFANQSTMAIVPYMQDGKLAWANPLELLIDSEIVKKDEIYMINQIYKAYRLGNQDAFDQSTINYNGYIREALDAAGKKPPKIGLELFYNGLKPFANSKFLYGFAFVFALLASFMASSWFNKASYLLSGLAFIATTTGIILRMLVLDRPPVTNLFETFIFVSWICVLLGMIIASFTLFNKSQKLNLGLVLASFSGLALLLISGKFAAEGDTMKVLIAVLDSNFWLSTHVICVTIGYAGVFAAGIVGHIYLIQRVLGADEDTLKTSFGALMAILGFGLCFSFLGTMLGGVWADQSWGRFWGWDPKENGALLIILWTAIIFHARIAGLIQKIGVAVCSVIGDMVVMTSWFGINLLGVGLHSYGFTKGIATGLYSYYAFELVFLSVVIFLLSKSKLTVNDNKIQSN